MTESEWWAATKPKPLVEWLADAHWATDRKLRLLATACCWRVLFLANDKARLTSLLTLTESFADGKVSSESLREDDSAQDGDEFDEYELSDGSLLVDEAVNFAAEKDLLTVPGWYPIDVLSSAAEALREKQKRVEERRSQTRLLHDIFGPLPFRDLTAEPSWLTRDVQLLARGIYDDKAFDRMPILADALQDAGCANEDVLNHCRTEGWEHVRGCWVIDLLLGRPWREA